MNKGIPSKRLRLVRKLAIEQIGSKARLWIAFRGGFARVLRVGSDAQSLHQTDHPLAPTGNPIVTELGLDAWAARDVTVFLVNLLNQGGNAGIFSLMRAWLMVFPRIRATLGHIQGIAEEDNRIALTLFCNELKFYARLRLFCHSV